MTTLFLSRLGRTLPSRARLLHTSRYALSAAKPAVDAAPSGPPPSAAAAHDDGPGDQDAVTLPKSIPKTANNNTKTTPSKGRKSKKAKRGPPFIPESFLIHNILRHDALATVALDPAYQFPESLWQELKYSVHAGLAPKAALAAFDHSDHLVLTIPKAGATYLQDTLARQLATSAKADLVIFDAQDFVSLAQDNATEAMTLLPAMTKGVSNQSTILFQPQASDEEEGWEMQANILWLLENGGGSSKEKRKVIDLMTDRMLARFSHVFRKAILHHSGSEGQDGRRPTRAIVYLRDYGDMHDAFGTLMLKSLVMAIDDLRKQDHAVMVFAGHSPSLTRAKKSRQHRAMHDVVVGGMGDEGDDEDDDDEDNDNDFDHEHNISGRDNDYASRHGGQFPLSMMPLPKLPPMMHGMKCIELDMPLAAGVEQQFAKDASKRVGEINARQLGMMLQHKRVVGMQPWAMSDAIYQLDGIRDALWSPQDIDRRVTVAMGRAIQDNRDHLLPIDFAQAHAIVKANAQPITPNPPNSHTNTPPLSRFAAPNGQLDLDRLKRACSSYESRLLSRIVDPAKVHGSFHDIRAPATTIETLQTLISLPLQRPDLFQHGILKRNAIHGVLLFGPPGTGKTMLAKAVAKESGSRMLEIQASDIYEMYVGEGEKNVKAIFSLARKISPCVIFIDEVDSVMNRRQSDTTSNAHREIINQMMVEWDGLSSNNQGVVVMAATNRPFDLDDAVLRRMPRRVLVDLPKQEDRAAILRMLLADEQHDVSIEQLAQATEHYSGSDLKNVCITAALKSLQEQLPTLRDDSQQQQQHAPRTLTQQHFDHALKLVPASSSDEMQSLVEIRKWALKYGDGHQKKKPTTFGFQ
ncbi:P-loop containing nucleoside triphosphate hydrolase protein [Gongronella butleri]|nr:P-loop containing nucleoside triphosphate hydrolase protein [Gongronella butleri]